MSNYYLKCKHFHDSQIEGPWCDIKRNVSGKSLDCSKCEKNPNVPKCGNCKHFAFGIPKSKCLKVRGEVIFNSDGEPDGYVDNLKVRDKQIGCSFYEKET